MAFKKILSGRYFLIIASLLIIIVGTVGFTLVLRPSLESFRIARTAAKDAAGQAQTVADMLTKMQARNTQAALGSPAEIEKLKALFIGSPELAYVLTSIPRYAEATRFLITALDVGSASSPRAEATGPLRVIPIQAQLKGGGYNEFKEFLKMMTASTPLYDVISFTFDPKSATVSLNFNALAIQEDSSRPATLDPEFFADPRFKALRAPIPLPKKDPIGKDNPFAPFAEPSQ